MQRLLCGSQSAGRLFHCLDHCSHNQKAVLNIESQNPAELQGCEVFDVCPIERWGTDRIGHSGASRLQTDRAICKSCKCHVGSIYFVSTSHGLDLSICMILLVLDRADAANVAGRVLFDGSNLDVLDASRP